MKAIEIVMTVQVKRMQEINANTIEPFHCVGIRLEKAVDSRRFTIFYGMRKHVAYLKKRCDFFSTVDFRDIKKPGASNTRPNHKQ